MAAPTITVWHNPRCGKSRAALELLDEHGVEPAIRLYLKQPPTRSELFELVRLGLAPADMVRWKDEPARASGVSRDDSDGIVDLLVREPSLLERPILQDATRAIVGRQRDAVLRFVGAEA
jgi:arsenate reductase